MGMLIKCLMWSPDVITLTTLQSLVALEVVMVTSPRTENEYKAEVSKYCGAQFFGRRNAVTNIYCICQPCCQLNASHRTKRCSKCSHSKRKYSYMGSANERRHYIVTLTVIVWAIARMIPDCVMVMYMFLLNISVAFHRIGMRHLEKNYLLLLTTSCHLLSLKLISWVNSSFPSPYSRTK